MTKLNEMWTALAAYQPNAAAAGHGETWAKMCSERTGAAAYDAAYDAAFAGADGAAAYDAAARAARAAYAAAARAARAAAEIGSRV